MTIKYSGHLAQGPGAVLYFYPYRLPAPTGGWRLLGNDSSSAFLNGFANKTVPIGLPAADGYEHTARRHLAGVKDNTPDGYVKRSCRCFQRGLR
jgi:hypothetical protein